MTETLKHRLEQAPVADPFSDIPDERKAELKRMAQKEWETYNAGNGECSYTVTMIEINPSEAHRASLRAAKWYHKLRARVYPWFYYLGR